MKKKLLSLTSFAVIAVLAMGVFLGQGDSNALVPGTNILVSFNLANSGPGSGTSPSGQSNYGWFDATPISANGRFVAFYSTTNDLVANDTNNKADVFVRDLKSNTTVRANTSSSGVQANDGLPPISELRQTVAISSSGRYVAFISAATNLIDGTTVPSNRANQVYLKDLKTNTLSVVSKSFATGALGWGNPTRTSPTYVNGVSDDGRFVLWGGGRNQEADPGSNDGGFGHVYLTDFKNSTHKHITRPTGHTGNVEGDNTHNSDASMSCDGSIIAFTSVLPFDSSDTNGASDLHVVDVRNGYSTERITTNVSGKSLGKASISCNGRFITFTSNNAAFSSLLPPASTLMHKFLHDRIENETKLVDVSSSGVPANVSAGYLLDTVDDNGNVIFSSPTTNIVDGMASAPGGMLLKDSETGSVVHVSYDMNGILVSSGAPASISADGKYFAYPSNTNALTNNQPMFLNPNNYQQVVVTDTGL